MANTSSLLFQTLEESTLYDLLRKHTGCEPLEYSIQGGGLFNTTYRLTLTDGRKMILRVGPIHPELLMYYEHNMMEAETFVFKAMEVAGIPCSHIVAMGNVDERDFMLVDFIESLPLSGANLTSEERKVVKKEVGHALSQMHALTGSAYGRVAEVLAGRGHATWYDHVWYEVSTLMMQARECGSFTAAEAAHVEKTIQHCKDALSEVDRTTLCHGDLWDGNILVCQKEDGWHLAAIIDVDRAVYGDIDFDLGNPWIPSEDELIQPKNTYTRQIRRDIYSMMYFIYEAHVWYIQYNDRKIADRARRIVLKKCTELLSKPPKKGK